MDQMMKITPDGRVVSIRQSDVHGGWIVALDGDRKFTVWSRSQANKIVKQLVAGVHLKDVK